MDEMDRPFAPGPTGPEEHVPGPALILNRKQVAAVAHLAETCSAVRVEDRGAGYKRITGYGIKGEVLFERLITSDGRYGGTGLPD